MIINFDITPIFPPLPIQKLSVVIISAKLRAKIFQMELPIVNF